MSLSVVIVDTVTGRIVRPAGFALELPAGSFTVSASDVSISDAGGLITATTVEGALQEIFTALAALNAKTPVTITD